MKHLFIINPVAGKGKASDFIPRIQKAFENKPDIYFIEVTQHPGHATEIVRRYVATDTFRVYSVGGDGTLNEVLNGLAGSSSSLAVIPSGSGNDFIRSIVGTHLDSSLFIRTLQGTEAPVDLAKAGDKYFLNISSVGFDAEVVYNSNRFKRIPGVTGSFAYILAIIYSVFRSKGRKLTIEIDNQTADMSALLVTVANGQYYGGGIRPAPEARLDDGLFDLCLIRSVNRLKILSFFPKMIKGTHGSIKEVSFTRGSSIRIRSDADITLNVDGEISKVRDIAFEIIPKGIQVVIPKSHE